MPTAMLMMLIALSALAALAACSLALRPENITPVSVFAALWIIGLVAGVMRPLADIDWKTLAVLTAASLLLFIGERLVRSDGDSEDQRRGAGTGAARWYWVLAVLAGTGASWKLATSLGMAGGSLEVMLASNALRGAVTSGDIAFPPIATALTSCVYVAAALTGYLCRDRIRPRYLAHLAAVVVDSLAISGRGSFLIVAMITVLGMGVTWQGSRRKIGIALGGVASGVVALAVGLSHVIGRDDVGETLLEYVVAPVFGLDAYLRFNPPTGIHGPTLISALTAKFGGDSYDAGDFVWSMPFVGNVSSGFREVLSDLGVGGLLVFLPLGAATLVSHRAYRLHGGWAPYATAVSLYAYLGYFYYVSLGAFLPGWWMLAFSGAAAAVFARLQRHPSEQRSPRAS